MIKDLLKRVLSIFFLPIKYFLRALCWLSHSKERFTENNDSEYEEYNEVVTVDVYKPRLVKPGKRLTILHPILKGSNSVARIMANYFAIFHRRPCAIVHRGKYPFDGQTPDGFSAKLEAYIYNYYLMEKALRDNEYMNDDTHVVSIGTSMGGIVNMMLATYDRYDRYISLIAGAPIVSVMKDSTISDFDDWYNKQVKIHEMDINDVHDWYLESVKLDPIYKYKYIAPSKFYAITAFFDWVVPYKYQRSMVDKIGAQRNVIFPVGHYTIALVFPLVLLILSSWILTSTRTERINYVYDKIYR